MNNENYTPWDATEFLAGVEDEVILEYLIDALKRTTLNFSRVLWTMWRA